MDRKLLRITKPHLGAETLANHNSESLDFHNTAAWQSKAALQAADLATKEAGR